MATSLPLLALGGTAVADPVYPSQDEVDRARAAADGTAARVDDLQAQLGAQQTRLEDAQTQLSVAAEDYDEARALLDQRTQETAAAQDAAGRAAAAYAAARVDLGRMASESYRGTSDGYSPLATVLTSGSVDEYVTGRVTLEHLTGNRADVQQRAADARTLAESTATRAADAEQAQQDATDRAATARTAAQRAADTADALVADTRRRTDDLVAQLAQLRQTSVALEQQRQAGLEAERRAAAEAAARAAAEAAARAAAAAAAKDAARDASKAASKATAAPARRSGGSSPAATTVRRAAGPTAGADTAVDWALAQLGKPYLWAADGPDSFDCSGLTLRAWGAAGIGLPHSSRLQYSGEAKVDLSDLEPGDLVFYATDTSNASTIHHVGMVIAPGTMVEAPHSGANVRTASIYRSGLMPHGTRPA
ncbi:hypothetical protein GCM10009528_19490 [Kineococcus aurantiacus]